MKKKQTLTTTVGDVRQLVLEALQDGDAQVTRISPDQVLQVMQDDEAEASYSLDSLLYRLNLPVTRLNASNLRAALLTLIRMKQVRWTGDQGTGEAYTLDVR